MRLQALALRNSKSMGLRIQIKFPIYGHILQIFQVEESKLGNLLCYLDHFWRITSRHLLTKGDLSNIQLQNQCKARREMSSLSAGPGPQICTSQLPSTIAKTLKPQHQDLDPSVLTPLSPLYPQTSQNKAISIASDQI